jgi:hypothetical protein
MSRQLRDGLHAAAEKAGCSLNSFAVQVLAAAAGDASQFRRRDAQEIERDESGTPLSYSARAEHLLARGEYMKLLFAQVGGARMRDTVRKLDQDDPAFFMRWHAAQERADLPDVG